MKLHGLIEKILFIIALISLIVGGISGLIMYIRFIEIAPLAIIGILIGLGLDLLLVLFLKKLSDECYSVSNRLDQLEQDISILEEVIKTTNKNKKN